MLFNFPTPLSGLCPNEPTTSHTEGPEKKQHREIHPVPSVDPSQIFFNKPYLCCLNVFPFIHLYKNLGKSSFSTFSLFKLPQVMASMTFDVMNGKTSPTIRNWKN